MTSRRRSASCGSAQARNAAPRSSSGSRSSATSCSASSESSSVRPETAAAPTLRVDAREVHERARRGDPLAHRRAAERVHEAGEHRHERALHGVVALLGREPSAALEANEGHDAVEVQRHELVPRRSRGRLVAPAAREQEPLQQQCVMTGHRRVTIAYPGVGGALADLTPERVVMAHGTRGSRAGRRRAMARGARGHPVGTRARVTAGALRGRRGDHPDEGGPPCPLCAAPTAPWRRPAPPSNACAPPAATTRSAS